MLVSQAKPDELPPGWYQSERNFPGNDGLAVYSYRNIAFSGVKQPAYVYMDRQGWFWVSFEAVADVQVQGPFKDFEAAAACATLLRGYDNDRDDGMPEDTYGNGAY